MRARRLIPPAAALLLLGLWLARREPAPSPATPPPSGAPTPAAAPHEPLAGDRLLEGYGDPASQPLDDLRKLHALVSGYFSIHKDLAKHPIGGNADLAAALLGDNEHRRPMLRADHPVLDAEGRLIDRWGTPIFVHPEAARELTLRSAGPDRAMFTDDDLGLLPGGEILPSGTR